jgi:arylformamidase
LIDLTLPLDARAAPWPGDTPLILDWTMHLERGDSCSVSRITLSPHTGTHVDAPAHYLEDGSLADSLELRRLIGPAAVVDARGRDAITVELLRELAAEGSRLLVRTLERREPDAFPDKFPPLLPDAARWLVEDGLILYGTDAPSVDPRESRTLDAHRALGTAGIPILENLDLGRVEPGRYDLVALPLRLTEAEAAPLRAILLPPGSLRSR